MLKQYNSCFLVKKPYQSSSSEFEKHISNAFARPAFSELMHYAVKDIVENFKDCEANEKIVICELTIKIKNDVPRGTIEDDKQ